MELLSIFLKKDIAIIRDGWTRNDFNHYPEKNVSTGLIYWANNTALNSDMEFNWDEWESFCSVHLACLW